MVEFGQATCDSMTWAAAGVAFCKRYRQLLAQRNLMLENFIVFSIIDQSFHLQLGGCKWFLVASACTEQAGASE